MGSPIVDRYGRPVSYSREGEEDVYAVAGLTVRVKAGTPLGQVLETLGAMARAEPG
jgi:hypothetical protein